MTGFQNTAPASQMAPGIEGGFYGFNPIFTLVNPDEGQWNVGVGSAATPGAFVGRFAWANTANGQVTSAHPGVTTVRVGFVHRDQNVYIVGLLVQSSMLLTQGQGIDLLEDGPMWGRFAAGCSVGQKVYTSYADSSLRAAATASAATTTFSATTVSGSPNLTAVGAGAFAGQPISGAGIPASTFLVSVNPTAQTAVMSANATASATVTVTATTDFETAWTTRSACLSGEVAKLSVRG